MTKKRLWRDMDKNRQRLCVYFLILVLYFILLPELADFFTTWRASLYWKDRPPTDCDMGESHPDFGVIRYYVQAMLQVMLTAVTALYGVWASWRAPKRYQKFYGLATVLVAGSVCLTAFATIYRRLSYTETQSVPNLSSDALWHTVMVCGLMVAAGAVERSAKMRWTGVGLLTGWSLWHLWMVQDVRGNEYHGILDKLTENIQYHWLAGSKLASASYFTTEEYGFLLTMGAYWLPIAAALGVFLVLLLKQKEGLAAPAVVLRKENDNRGLLTLGILVVAHQILQPTVFLAMHEYYVHHVFDNISKIYNRACADLDIGTLWNSRCILFVLMAVIIWVLGRRLTDRGSRARVLWESTAAMYGTAAVLLPVLAFWKMKLSAEEVWFDAVFVGLLMLMWGIGLGHIRLCGAAAGYLAAVTGIVHGTAVHQSLLPGASLSRYSLWTMHMWDEGGWQRLSWFTEVLPIAGALVFLVVLATLVKGRKMTTETSKR